MTTTDIDIIGLQRRMRQLGEIRIGHVIDTGKISKKTGKPILRPEKLDKFRLTSASRPTLEEVAKLYGGTVARWTPANGGPQEWEVYTDTDRLPVIIPPKNAVTQCYEMYKGSKCVRRCNGRVEEKTDRACMCDPDERDCALTTRLNVMLRDVPGLGVWLLTSHGYYAAVELPPVAEFLASTNGYVDAWLTMELKRVPRDDGPMAEFMVPKLDIAVTPAQLLAGQGTVSPQAVDAMQQRAVVAGQVPPVVASRPAVPGQVERPAAIEAPTPAPQQHAAPDPSPGGNGFVGRIRAASSSGEVTAVLRDARSAGADMRAVSEAANTRMGELRNGNAQPAQPVAKENGGNLSAEEHIKAAFAATTLDQLTAALDKAQAEGYAPDFADANDTVAAAFMGRRQLLTTQETPAAAAPAADPERLWAEIVTAASLEGFERTDAIEAAFATRWNGDQPGAASATQLATFLAEIKDGKVRPPQAVSTAPTPVTDSEVPF